VNVSKAKFRIGQKLILNVKGHYKNEVVKVVRKHYFKGSHSWGYYFQFENGQKSTGAIDEDYFKKNEK
jgi:hypothetical protein